MLFSSLTFLIFFLPVVMGLYFALPWRFKNGFLFLASLVFYAWASPTFLLLLLLETGVGYLAGLGLEKRDRQSGRWILWAAVLLYAGLFVYFKYTDFLISTFNSLFQTSVPLLKIVLPAGISFYTFQIISYNADVWNRKAPAVHSFVQFGMYISLFCQLIAGPIVRYTDIEPDLQHRMLSLSQTSQGWNQFVCGLCKKILVANQLYAFCEGYRTSPDPSLVYAWMHAVSLTLYIYFDFSGYSDMAIGLGKMLGFHFPRNFDYPLMAATVTDFWRRWHMSLTAWFRDYVYIPLGGSRCERWKVIRNLLIVWLFTGLWHGASWNFVLWGLGFFVLLVLEKFVIVKWKLPTWFSRMVVVPVILVSFLLFSDESLAVFAQDVKDLFGFGGLPFMSPLTWYTIRGSLILLAAAVLGTGSTPRHLYERLTQSEPGQWAAALVTFGGLFLCIAELTAGSFNPFLYFRF